MKKIVMRIHAVREICLIVPDDFEDIDDLENPFWVSELCEKSGSPKTDWRIDENEGVEISTNAEGYDPDLDLTAPSPKVKRKHSLRVVRE